MSCFSYFTYCNGQRLVSIYYPKSDKSNKIFFKTIPSYLALDQSTRHSAKSGSACPNRVVNEARKKTLDSYEDVLRIKKSLNTFETSNYKCNQNQGITFH